MKDNKEYFDFLKTKEYRVIATGINKEVELNPMLFHYQSDIVRRALKRGRAAIFSECGTGKTLMQLEWAKHVTDYTKGNILILAPLAVNVQTVLEGAKFGIIVNHCRSQSEVKPGINITNYEMLHKFEPDTFSGIVLDKSSCLKSEDSKYRNLIINSFEHTQFKLACTATPAPNDFMELGNHSEFLGVMSRVEMLATFFVHDGGETAKWRLKGHAEKEFWKWMCKWSVMVQYPSDLGYSNDGFILPTLNLNQIVVNSEPSPGMLFATDAKTLLERQQARRDSIDRRVLECAEIVNNSEGPFLVWCNLNAESEKLTKQIKGAVEVKGSDSNEKKEKALLGFSNGDIRVLVTKPSIAGHGMNWQHCRQMAFVGLSDSFEEYYQAVRRCWRFGQDQEVDANIIISEAEGAVLRNIERKEKDANRMRDEMIKNMKDEMNKELHGLTRDVNDYNEDVINSGTKKEFSINELCREVHQIAVDHGFYDPARGEKNIAEILCLIHSEVSEALEELRKVEFNKPAFSEELADIIIRVCDLIAFMNIDIDPILNAKIEANRNRPIKHGKVF